MTFLYFQQTLLNNSLEPFAVVKHANGRDWWIVTPDFGTNNYNIILVSKHGIEHFPGQTIGPELAFPPCRWERSTVFSPDGLSYARFNNYCGMIVMDFDRCLGSFSNPFFSAVRLPLTGGGGVAFSSNSENIYCTHYNWISKLNRTAIPDTLPETYPIMPPYGYTFYHLELGPDDKIYGSALSSERYLHYIDSINQAGESVAFQPKGLQLPVLNARTLPYFPNYRLGRIQGSVCDSISTSWPVTTTKKIGVDVLPNPANHTVQVKLPGLRATDIKNGRLQLLDLSGKQLFQMPILSQSFELNLSEYQPGVYVILIQTTAQIYSGRLVVH